MTQQAAHGSVRRYRYGCRCVTCTTAFRARHARLLEERQRRGPKVHGLNGYLNYRCRCEICRKAKAEYKRRMRNDPQENPGGRQAACATAITSCHTGSGHSSQATSTDSSTSTWMDAEHRIAVASQIDKTSYK